MKILLPTILKYSVLFAFFLSFFIIPFLLFGKDMEDFATAFLTEEGNDGPAMLVAGALLAGDPVLPTPSSLVATLLAAKTGFWPAAIVNAVSLSLACVIGFALGRGGGAAMVRTGLGLPPGFVEWVSRHGLIAVLLCRPIPVLAEASLILAGAAHQEPRWLLISCSLSQTVLGFAYAFAGSGWSTGRWDSFAVLAGSVGIPVLMAMIVAVSLYWQNQRRPA